MAPLAGYRRHRCVGSSSCSGSGSSCRPPPSAAAADATGRLLVTLKRGATAPPAAAHAVAAAAGAPPSGFSVPQIRLVTVAPAPGRVAARARAPAARRPARGLRRAERRGALRFQPNDPALRRPRRRRTPRPARPSSGGRRAAASSRRGTSARGRARRSRSSTPAPRSATRSSPGRSPSSRPSTPRARPPGLDTVGHGTHVASLACATGNNGVGLAGAGLGCRLSIVKSDFSDSSVARVDRLGGRPRRRRDQHELRHRPGRDAVACPSSTPSTTPSPTASCSSRPPPTTRSRTRATRRARCSRPDTAPDLNAGLGPVGHGRRLPRPPRAVRRARHADLARRLRHLRGNDNNGPAGHLRRVHRRR